MPHSDLAFTSASELLRLISEKQVSPVELTELYLRRIEELDPQLNSYLTVDHEGALQFAKKAEAATTRGESFGPLHGLPISIKDLEPTKGIRTTSGSLIFRDRVADEDSIVVERVRQAGAVILGKTNTPEFGMSGTTENRLGEPCRNPWNTDRTSGGSSGGAGAALASGLCPLATGSDGGGSIRIPSSFCGVYGIKPTQGRVPQYKGASSSGIANQLSQSGPMSRTVRDSALLLQVLAGHNRRDPISLREPPPDLVEAVDREVAGLRIGWSADFGFAAVDREVVETTSQAALAFGDLGCTVDEADLVFESAFDAFMVVFCTNLYTAFGHLMEDQRAHLADYVVRILELGRAHTGADYSRALGYFDRLKAQFADLFSKYDLLLSPTMAVSAFPIGQPPTEIDGRKVDPWFGYLPFTFPINMIGHPAASVPCGFSHDGMPIGLHIIGRLGDESTVVAASAAFERARPWANLRPPVS